MRCLARLLRNPDKKAPFSASAYLCSTLDAVGTRRSLKCLRFAALFVCFAGPCISQAQCIPEEHSLRMETFSAVEVIRGVGPAGSELRLEEQGKKVVATLRDYRGSAIPEATKLHGLLQESAGVGDKSSVCQIRLSGLDKQGRVTIEGEITLARFRGVVTRYIGKDIFSYRISLKREMRVYDYYPGAL
jgi:hypothetical protein